MKYGVFVYVYMYKNIIVFFPGEAKKGSDQFQLGDRSQYMCVCVY